MHQTDFQQIIHSFS